MKILHITATHLNPTGGVPVVLWNLIEGQNRIPDTTSLLLSLRANTDMIDNEKFYYRERKEWSTFIDEYEPDIAILHSFFYLEYITLSIMLKKKGIPYYIEPHGSFGKAANKKSRIKKVLANNTVFRPLINGAYGFIFLSDEEMIDSIYRKNHDIVVPNGINIIGNYEKTIRHEESLYYIGRYDINHKGLDVLFDALKILDNNNKLIKIDFYGTGNETEVQYVNSQIEQLKNIKCTNHGPLYGEDKKRELERHGIMILTSRYEGFPMTILEAWQMGIPCIVTPGTNVSVITKRENIGWVADFDAVSIAKTIMEALSLYDSDSNGYINRTIEFVNKNYSWTKIAEQSAVTLRDELGL